MADITKIDVRVNSEIILLSKFLHYEDNLSIFANCAITVYFFNDIIS